MAAPAAKPTSPAPQEMLRLENVCVEVAAARRSTPILSNVSLSVRPGEILGLVGETGSGKSVTARAILGVLPPAFRRTAGAVYFRDQPLTARALSAARGVGLSFVPQDLRGALHPTLSVLRQFNILLGKHRDLRRPEIEQRAAASLAHCGIRDVQRVLKSYSHELSGGMAQRVAIALAMSLEADVLIADEPTTGCDTTVQRQILDVLSGRVAESRTSLLLITHDLGVVGTYCDAIAVMKSGVIVEHGSTREVLDRPTHEYTQALVTAARTASAGTTSALVESPPPPAPPRQRGGARPCPLTT